jgi:hypothetical protein
VALILKNCSGSSEKDLEERLWKECTKTAADSQASFQRLDHSVSHFSPLGFNLTYYKGKIFDLTNDDLMTLLSLRLCAFEKT